MMELYSAAFIGFVIISVIVHEIVGRKRAGRQWIVRLIASAAFYTVLAEWRVIFLLCSIVTVWYGARKLDTIAEDRAGTDKSSRKRRRKAIVAALLVVNLGILVTVKYYLPFTSHRMMLPLGISYYTLMAVSYVVDVYGQKYKCEKNIAKLALYMTWFPQVIQGPINRYDYVCSSLFGTHRVARKDVSGNVALFLFGALKKYAIANVMIGAVGEIFGGDLSPKPGGFLFLGAVLYALCQYADFSGGFDMMVAVSRLFGVEMNANFRQPYFAKSIAEFWRRWHITLGSFMKDYVFFPFAANRGVMKLYRKIGKKYGNHMARSIIGGIGNLLVFFLVGLWHGPKVHFIMWGLFNGLIIAVSDMCEPRYARIRSFCHVNEDSRLWNGFRIVRTFVIICFAGYLDYIENLKDSVMAFKNTFLHFNPAVSRLWVIDLFDSKVLSMQKIVVFLLSVLILASVDVIKERKGDPLKVYFDRPVLLRWIFAYFALILLLMSFTLVGFSGGFMYAAF